MRRLILLLALILAPTLTARAAPDLPPGLAAGGSAMVIAIVDGDTLVLDDDSEVRLVGIQAPKLPLGRPSFQKWPLADEAKQALADLALGQQVWLGYGGQQWDRHNRRLAHLVTGDGQWLQGAMLEQGLARVYSFPDNRALIPALLAAESRGRDQHRGIWRHPFYTILDHLAAAQHIGKYALVEGEVMDIAVVRGRGYLNFGADYRTDFTISIAPRDLKKFPGDQGTLETFLGKNLRVRGWLEWRNGPMINVTHPEQIEVLPQ